MARKREKIFNQALVTWSQDQWGTGKKYTSGRKWAKAAGRNVNAVNILEDSGDASAELLIDLARAIDQSPTEVLKIAGYLSPEEIGPPTFKVTDLEQEMVEGYRDLPVEGQKWMLGSLQGMRQFVEDSS